MPNVKTGRGRPRKKGARLPSLEDLTARARFRACTVQRNGQVLRRWVYSRTCLWYRGTPQPIRLVIVRQPQGPAHTLFSTDGQLPPERIVELYAARWGIEELIREVKQSLGFEHVQSWTAAAVRPPWRWCCTPLSNSHTTKYARNSSASTR